MPTSPHTPAPAPGSADRTAPVLSVKDLEVAYRTGKDTSVRALRGVSFDLYPESSLALVGESGCGKTTLGNALAMIATPPLYVLSGTLEIDGESIDLSTLSVADLKRHRPYRGRTVSMLPQGAMNSISPTLRIRSLVHDVMRAHDPRVSRDGRVSYSSYDAKVSANNKSLCYL